MPGLRRHLTDAGSCEGVFQAVFSEGDALLACHHLVTEYLSFCAFIIIIGMRPKQVSVEPTRYALKATGVRASSVFRSALAVSLRAFLLACTATAQTCIRVHERVRSCMAQIARVNQLG